MVYLDEFAELYFCVMGSVKFYHMHFILPVIPLGYSFNFDCIISGRTFPAHPYYMQTLGPGQLALFNVLKAYSLLDQEVGYCQGLSFVGGILLLHVSLCMLF